MPDRSSPARRKTGVYPGDVAFLPPVSMYEPNCFLICPFLDSKRNRDVKNAVREAAAGFGFVSFRVDERHTSAEVMEKIHHAIRWSNFVVADLTDERQNCYFELGLAVATTRVQSPPSLSGPG